MSCVKCGYCEHCGRSNSPQISQPYWVYPYWMGQWYSTTTSGSITVSNGGLHTTTTPFTNIQNSAQCGHAQSESKDAPIPR